VIGAAKGSKLLKNCLQYFAQITLFLFYFTTISFESLGKMTFFYHEEMLGGET